ncbi:MAG: UDP-N-acetylmuramate--L-alanine ligase [Bacteroidales bacterium]|nr:UDP-N-acetylmuramate--L-alanine ligase [Bacteroidales bacterium]
MEQIADIKKLYFLGIGGIGMSALARYFHVRGVEVTGYDRTPSPLTDTLIKEGISIHFEDNPALIPADISAVIYTPAIPKTLKELQYLQQKNIPILKRSSMLGMISDAKTTFAVAGTHGKTSTTAMISYLLHAEKSISAFIGGISANFDSNFVDDTNADIVVVEADEFDRSFLTLHPHIAVITAMDADHLDIYGTQQSLEHSFNDFANQIDKNGYLITKPHLLDKLSVECNIVTYSYNDNTCDYYAKNIRFENGVQQFDIQCQNVVLKDVTLAVAGKHNIENAVASVAVATLAGISTEAIKKQLATYKGVKRRFEYIIQRNDFVYIDDYAHHPKEISTCIDSAKILYPDKKICGVFQPHLYTRTRDFADDFAKSLSKLDSVILLDIYPARELPIEGITSEFLLDKITCKDKRVLQKEELIDYLSAHQPDVLLTMGAGDIDRLVTKIKERFNE